MSAHGNDTRLVAPDAGAPRDALVAELRQSNQRLQNLYDIGKILLRFRSSDETMPAVLAALARTLPLRSAIFVLTRWPPLTLAFLAEGDGPQELREAKAHAREAIRDLGPTVADLELSELPALGLPPLPRACRELPVSERKFVLLPLIVKRGAIFGALQIEPSSDLNELDLTFVSAIVDQLATALERDAADRAMRDSEARLAAIVSMAADAVITVDEGMHIVLYNEGAERIFGWTAAEVLGKGIELLLPARFGAAHRGHVRDFHASADIARRMGARRPEIFGRRKSGQEFPADAAISKLRLGESWLFTVILRDISEQKRVERERSFLAEVSDILSGTLDKEQTLDNVARLAMRDRADFCVIEFVDERGAVRRIEVLASSPDKADIAAALKAHALDLGGPGLSAGILAANRAQIVAKVSPELLRSMARDEEQRRLLEALGLRTLMGVPLTVGGKTLGALIVGSCAPDRPYHAADLHLLTEVGQRAALALENARLYHVAQLALQVRDDVLGSVAHDLRNPLSNIMLQADLLRRDVPASEPRRRQTGEVIQRAATRMQRLIQDLLDVSSMNAGHFSIERSELSVHKVMSDLLESQQATAISHLQRLRLDPAARDLRVWADRERLLQVLENLVGNAAKFTPPEGSITIGARMEADDVLFWVEDSGAGIAAADLAHLFDRFWQVRKTDGRGVGLGLAIVKGLVEAHGGRVWVESILGAGSTFFFTIPARAP